MSRRSLDQIAKARGRKYSLREALYHAAHDTPGGVTYIAGSLGQGVTSVSNAVDLEQPDRDPTLKHFEAICRLSKDPRVLHAIGEMFGDLVWFERLNSPDTPDELLVIFNNLLGNVHHVTRGISESLADDNKIDNEEWSQLSYDLDRFISLAHQLREFAKEKRDER